MQHEFKSGTKGMAGAAALLLLASTGFAAYAAGDDTNAGTPHVEAGATPAAAAATANMNAGQNNLRPSYTVSSPAPGVVAVTPNSQPAPSVSTAPSPPSPPPSGPMPPSPPPNQTAPYAPNVPPAPPSGQR